MIDSQSVTIGTVSTIMFALIVFFLKLHFNEVKTNQRETQEKLNTLLLDQKLQKQEISHIATFKDDLMRNLKNLDGVSNEVAILKRDLTACFARVDELKQQVSTLKKQQ